MCWQIILSLRVSCSDNLAQEVAFSWNASDHIALNETYNTIAEVGTEAAPFDYFHINSVEKDLEGDYLVSVFNSLIPHFLIPKDRFQQGSRTASTKSLGKMEASFGDLVASSATSISTQQPNLPMHMMFVGSTRPHRLR
jgi:Arylsulfotransferase (ASST)